MDCWWNAAVENQGELLLSRQGCLLNMILAAIDRVHRIGATRTVYVKHFIVRLLPLVPSSTQPLVQVSDTIEDRILQIQKRKTAIVKEAFRGKGAKSDPESMDNLKIMFGMHEG